MARPWKSVSFAEPKDVPCPVCYTPLKKTDEGMECPRHGLNPEKKRRANAVR